MTALAHGTVALALVMGLALLCTRRISAASIVLTIQCAAVAVSAAAMRQPILAAPPLLLGAGAWLAGRSATSKARPLGDAKLAIGAGVVLAIICQSQVSLGMPVSVILLSVLLATIRQHPLTQMMALVGIQNGIVLVACSPNHAVGTPALLAVACFVLPFPLAAGGFRLNTLMKRGGNAASAWFGWIDLAMSLGIFAATILIPVDLTASVFAPLLAVDGVMRSWQRRKRLAMSPAGRGLALLTSGLFVVAICPQAPGIAWLAVLAAIMTSLLPTLPRLWTGAVLAVLGAGIALCGLLLILGPSIPGYFMVFAGFAAIAAVVPDLAVVLVILLLRFANQTPWPMAADVLGTAVSLLALLACAVRLRGKSPRAAVPLLLQSQSCIATLSLCLGQADGRFAALVLLILLILTRAAARVPDGPVATLAIAGLGGVPPMGVFPGLVLVVLATIVHNAWLLLPLGAAAIPILLTSQPKGLRGLWPQVAVPSAGWLPLALALLTGYFAPDKLVRWWHVLTAGQ